MTEGDWIIELERLVRQYPLKLRTGVDDITLFETERLLGEFPKDLRSFYRVANGFLYEWVNFLPIELRNDIKNTWDGLIRANNPKISKFLGRDADLFDQFLVIADIGRGHCACIQKKSFSIWFLDEEGIHQTNMNLLEFILTALREVRES